MPELPEAELTRETLDAWLAGREIRDVHTPDARTRRGQDPAAIRSAVAGRRVSSVRRRGKFLRIEFDRPESGRRRLALLNHLGMTGRWVRLVAPAEDPPAVRAALVLPDGVRVAFRDPRRFGFVSVCRPEDDRRLDRLGPEPLASTFTARRLAERIGGRRRAIKPLLMDQDRIAGIGNIQATEALWRAGIHPERPASNLSPTELRRLHRALRATLRRTIREARGAEIHYVSEGGAGKRSTRSRFAVYGRAGEPCPACRHGSIERTRISGRGSFLCPRCQPRPDALTARPAGSC